MEEMQDYFTHTIIKKIPGKPTREDVKKAQDKTCENAAGTPCELGVGSHGHLGTTMANAKHNSTTSRWENHHNRVHIKSTRR